MPTSDIRVLEVQPYFSVERAREPLKFGSVVMDEITLCHVRAWVENRRGQVAAGWGAIFLSDSWAFPTPHVGHAVKDRAMRRITAEVCRRVSDYGAFAHPLNMYVDLEKDLDSIRQHVCQEMALPEEMPFLGALVCASPVDAALHDAFGVVNGVCSYGACTSEFMAHDLSAYLGPDFQDRYLSDFLRPAFSSMVPVFHLVGGLDTLHADEVGPDAPQDGRPNSLDRWIEEEGLFCLKVKLRGTDLAWDLNRLLSVYHVAREAQSHQGRDNLYMSVDTNEQCESPAYMVELLRRLQEAEPRAYEALLYVEQPTERDLRAHRFDMHELAALKPVIVDESLTGLEDMDLALALGWSGVALKTCKCHSMALLIAARAEAARIPYSVQDLTNPGLSLLHSVGLAARLHPIMGVEANSRQYYPDTSAPEAEIHSDIVRVRNGMVCTETLRGPGFGYQIERIDRPIFNREDGS